MLTELSIQAKCGCSPPQMHLEYFSESTTRPTTTTAPGAATTQDNASPSTTERNAAELDASLGVTSTAGTDVVAAQGTANTTTSSEHNDGPVEAPANGNNVAYWLAGLDHPFNRGRDAEGWRGLCELHRLAPNVDKIAKGAGKTKKTDK